MFIGVNRVQNNKGMTLVEIMVVVAILAVVSAGIMTLMNSLNQVIVQTRSSYDAMELKTLTNDILFSEGACSVTFNDPAATTPLTFQKTNIDDPASGEGIALTDLWLSNANGTARTQSLLSTTDATKQMVGKLKITEIKFAMDNGTGANFPEGESVDRGTLAVKYEILGMSHGNNIKSLKIPFWMKVNTDTGGTSTFVSCSKSRSDLSGGGGSGAGDGLLYTTADLLGVAQSRGLKVQFGKKIEKYFSPFEVIHEASPGKIIVSNNKLISEASGKEICTFKLTTANCRTTHMQVSISGACGIGSVVYTFTINQSGLIASRRKFNTQTCQPLLDDEVYNLPWVE